MGKYHKPIYVYKFESTYISTSFRCVLFYIC